MMADCLMMNCHPPDAVVYEVQIVSSLANRSIRMAYAMCACRASYEKMDRKRQKRMITTPPIMSIQNPSQWNAVWILN